MLIDSHCHLDYFPENLQEILSHARLSGVKLLQTISTSIVEFPKVYAIAHTNHDVFASVGLHPLNCLKERNPTADEIVEIISQHEKVISIGETGLDFHYENDTSSHNIQTESFIQHIIASQTTSLPVVIHTRDAENATMKIIDEMYDKKAFYGVFHCFTASEELARFAISKNMYVSASGILTFKKSDSLRAIFKSFVPLDKLLIETDAPYLAPEPYRGKVNQPGYLVHVAQKMADLYDISIDEMIRITGENFCKLFNKVLIAKPAN